MGAVQQHAYSQLRGSTTEVLYNYVNILKFCPKSPASWGYNMVHQLVIGNHKFLPFLHVRAVGLA
jgi:hypothetical protein